MAGYGRRINLNESTVMSLIFLLGGFPQAVIYGSKVVWAATAAVAFLAMMMMKKKQHH
jgi:hypothetical protein